MTILISILLFLAVWHFSYEGIIAPVLRHGLRYKLFALRDRLRMLDIDGAISKKDEEIYHVLDGTICYVLDTMNYLNFLNYFTKKKAHGDKKLRKRLNYFDKLLDESENKELVEIHKLLLRNSFNAFAINNGGWAIYLIAPILLFLLIKSVGVFVFSIKSKLFNITKTMVYSSNYIGKNGTNVGFA
jgi:hypothetical protein